MMISEREMRMEGALRALRAAFASEREALLCCSPLIDAERACEVRERMRLLSLQVDAIDRALMPAAQAVPA